MDIFDTTDIRVSVPALLPSSAMTPIVTDGVLMDTDTNRNLSKLARNKSRLVFLLKCRRYEILPRFILDRTTHLFSVQSNNASHNKKHIDSLASVINKKLLNLEIAACSREINSIQVTCNTSAMSTQCLAHYRTVLKSHNDLLFEKFARLKSEQGHLSDINYDPTFIKNYTQHEIPPNVLILLGLGSKFAIAPSTLPIPDLLTDLECITQQFAEENQRKPLRGHLLYTLTKYTKTPQHSNRIIRFLQTALVNTKRFLHDNPDVMVTTSDKGGVTIISSKHDYTLKMNALIHNAELFNKLDYDPTDYLQRRNAFLVSKLYKQKFISLFDKKRLTSYTSIAPRIYGQLKYHKPDLPVRPIVSTIKSPAYALSRYLATVLRQAFIKPKYNIKNSTQFVRKARKIRVSEGNILVSFDVVNCFGTISTDLAIGLIQRDFDLVARHTDIPKELFIQLLRFCMEEANYFCYKDEYYQQKLGMFMGSSLAPILVERVIEEAVSEMMNRLDFTPDFWVIYVDDHLTSIPESKVDHVMQLLNSYNANVQFTVERQHEQTNTINYLDVTVHNANGIMRTNWFCKPIASNRLLNFYSAHPEQMKRNVAKAFIRRVLCLSHRIFFSENLERIKSILIKNNFPEKLTNTLIHQTIGNYNHSRSNERAHRSYPFLNETTIDSSAHIGHETLTQSGTPPPNTSIENPVSAPKYGALTYIPGFSDEITRQLKHHLPDVRVASKPAAPLRHTFTNMKAKTPLNEISGVVYKIPCNGCTVCYIGETGQKLKNRSAQHQRDLSNKDKQQKTALVSHAFDTEHTFETGWTAIIHREERMRRRKIQETNHIILNEEFACNFKKDSEHVSPLYYNLLKSYGASIQRTHSTDSDMANNSQSEPRTAHTFDVG